MNHFGSVLWLLARHWKGSQKTCKDTGFPAPCHGSSNIKGTPPGQGGGGGGGVRKVEVRIV